MVIGAILVAVAILLVYETRALMMGESADTDVVRSVRAIAENDPSVDGVARLLTMQLGPHRVLLNIDVQFRPHLSARELFDAVDRIEGRVRRAHPEMQDIFVEIEALRHAGQANR